MSLSGEERQERSQDGSETSATPLQERQWSGRARMMSTHSYLHGSHDGWFCSEIFCCTRTCRCCARTRVARSMRTRHSVKPLDLDKFVGEVGLRPPIFKVPAEDIARGNEIVEVSFGEATDEDGIEVTVIFRDEDRPNRCEDRMYDCIRLPLFGRKEDIETFIVNRNALGEFDSITFPGTYSGDQDWGVRLPTHFAETVPLSEFVQEDGRVVLWVNVWNHLFGPRNNNPAMEMTVVADYPCTMGNRDDVDRRYVGMMTTVPA